MVEVPTAELLAHLVCEPSALAGFIEVLAPRLASTDMPQGLADVSKFPDLFAELIRRGWADADLMKLAGRNILRALRQNEIVARGIQRERPPSTATIDKLDRAPKTSDR